MSNEFRRRIGVFGGTFDPPHIGHTSAALAAMRNLELDSVLMVVANDPWQKTGQNKNLSKHNFHFLIIETKKLSVQIEIGKLIHL